ncbi:MAG: UdgX family uracil-DNA binding protein [Gemmatimonadetes bacterium]|nr:UdgX family uracil-DNA binding protein [Gemmatimonadota bacterium]
MPVLDVLPVPDRPWPTGRITLQSLREAARGCTACPLFKHATQTVFGRGPESARIMLVGEQPGNDEDLGGLPFVGPAGRVLADGLRAAAIDPADAYVTNVVKHFKWVPRGKRRIHQKPSAREVDACRPWIDEEMALVRPQVLVPLGATAAQALLGSSFRVTRQRGRDISTPLAPHTVATVHPSSILRQQTSGDREREMEHFIEDLRVVARLLDDGDDTPSHSL